MKLSIYGSSNIIFHHIISAAKNSFQIYSICTSNKKSKNIQKLAKKFKIKKIYYDWKKFIKDIKKNNSNILIAGRINDNEKILSKCLKANIKSLVEKPLFTKSNKFNKFLKYNKNIFVGYNRIYYKSIKEIKKIIKEKKTENILINCPEINKKNIILNSCHIISIIFYLYGKISLEKKIKTKNSIFCIFRTKKKIPVYINVNFNSPENFSIEFNFRKKKVILKPIEKLVIYNKIKIKKYRNESMYNPSISKTINEHEYSNSKPGFDLQYLNFKKFIEGKKSQFITINNAKQIIQICNEISK